MEKKKGTVIQAKFIEEYKPKDKTYYVFGVAIKYGNNPKTDVDSGLYYATDKDQKDFVPAQEVEYTIKIDEKYPNDIKKSRIKPWKEEKKSFKTEDGNVKDRFWMMQQFDALKYTPAYAKDICVAKIAAGNYADGDFEKHADAILKWWHGKIEEIKKAQ